MLGACTDNSRLMKADFKANLKTVKKEEEKVKMRTDETSAAKHKRVLLK